jgi:hypothetical protein
MTEPTTTNRPRRRYRPLSVYGLTCPNGHEIEIVCSSVKDNVGLCPVCSAECRIEWGAASA